MSGAFSPGTTVGRYLIEAEVGRDGMGVVYRALDPALNRAVAVKVLAQMVKMNLGLRVGHGGSGRLGHARLSGRPA
ncbi:MAG: hypothetical protein ACT4QE_12655 [Anaerolineales bacterium]